jgi:hypothetical protein
MLVKYLNDDNKNMWLNPEQVVAICPMGVTGANITTISDGGRIMIFASNETPDQAAEITNGALQDLERRKH